MYKDRRLRKRDFRGLWIQRINGALSTKGISYSKFMGALSKNNVELNRKTLSELAIHHPDAFDQVVTITQK
jgi:large subunit ribosomal protein L20